MFQLYLLLRLKNFGRINRNNKRTIYRRYRLMAVRRLITLPEKNKTGTQTCPSSFSLQRKL